MGDPFEVELSDGSRQTLTLTGITENYVFTRLYLSQTQLKRLTGGTLPAWNTLYAQTSCPDTDARNALRTDLLACNYVGSVSFIEDTTEMFDNLIGCLNYVVILVIVCAAALAAVVLYNLISVNLGERKKELATIKVLGFYDKEVYRYIFREIDLLALIGSLVGLALGVPLHQFIIRTVEMDQMMFIRAVAPRSYLFQRCPHPLLHRRRLPPHAPPHQEDQYGGKHEGTGIINKKGCCQLLPTSLTRCHLLNEGGFHSESLRQGSLREGAGTAKP